MVRERPFLTRTQLEILAGAGSGETVKETARRIHISSSHAYNELQRIKAQLDAPTLPACVMRAHALGLISHPTGPQQLVFAAA